ncbi:MAG: hypothetical protein M1828_004330 [Chrysothrix sp. TS-e1954]|nr:MAG: hypothetical protein M1828_004330 [Chrysothrix sp. TS-e1954]
MPSPPSLFLVGATGYIGGSLLTHLLKTHEDWHITCLVRSSAQESTLRELSPNVSSVVGSLDTLDVLRAEASKADIVVNCSDCDKEAGILALVDGTIERQKVTDVKPLIVQVSGTASLVDRPVSYGAKVDRVRSDVDDIDEILAFDPSNRLHVKVDQAFMSKCDESGVRDVLLAPGAVFGRGTGPFKKQTYVSILYEAIAGRGRPFVVGEGESRWSASSVRDAASAIAFFLEEGIKAPEACRLRFGRRGFYFIESFEMRTREWALEAAGRLVDLGRIKNLDVESLTVEEAGKSHPFLASLIGTSSRCRADRLKALGWMPAHQDWKPLMKEWGVDA